MATNVLSISNFLIFSLISIYSQIGIIRILVFSKLSGVLAVLGHYAAPALHP